MMRAKLNSICGESIAETLVAVLIAAFALLMLAGTINTATRIITNSQNKLEDYYDANNKLVDHTAASKDAVKIIIKPETAGGLSGEFESESWNVKVYTLTDTESSMLGEKKLISYEVE